MLDRPFDPRSDMALVAAARERMHGYLRDLVAAKRADLLRTTCSPTSCRRPTRASGSIAQELLAMTFLLLIAGYVTTVSLIGNGTLALLRRPDQLDRLRPTHRRCRRRSRSCSASTARSTPG